MRRQAAKRPLASTQLGKQNQGLLRIWPFRMISEELSIANHAQVIHDNPAGREPPLAIILLNGQPLYS